MRPHHAEAVPQCLIFDPAVGTPLSQVKEDAQKRALAQAKEAAEAEERQRARSRLQANIAEEKRQEREDARRREKEPPFTMTDFDKFAGEGCTRRLRESLSDTSTQDASDLPRTSPTSDQSWEDASAHASSVAGSNSGERIPRSLPAGGSEFRDIDGASEEEEDEPAGEEDGPVSSRTRSKTK